MHAVKNDTQVYYYCDDIVPMNYLDMLPAIYQMVSHNKEKQTLKEGQLSDPLKSKTM